MALIFEGSHLPACGRELQIHRKAEKLIHLHISLSSILPQANLFSTLIFNSWEYRFHFSWVIHPKLARLTSLHIKFWNPAKLFCEYRNYQKNKILLYFWSLTTYIYIYMLIYVGYTGMYISDIYVYRYTMWRVAKYDIPNYVSLA